MARAWTKQRPRICDLANVNDEILSVERCRRRWGCGNDGGWQCDGCGSGSEEVRRWDGRTMSLGRLVLVVFLVRVLSC
jgi:hypothetical protein